MMEPDKEHRKPTRLKDFSYRGCYRYFITVRSHNFERRFVTDEVVARVLGILEDTAEHESFSVWAYCFMPDHAHLLVEGKNGRADMQHFIALFKQRTSHWFTTAYGAKLWASNYYEHVLRSDEATMAVARYIIENPIRKGMVDDCGSYPYSGSFELEDICSL